MSKQKKRHKKKKDEWKKTLKFELFGLILLALTCIGISNLGIVGSSLGFLFRFFIGEWYMLGLLGLLTTSFYIIWKRDWPSIINRPLIGAYLIVCSILLLSHVTLFRLLSQGGTLVHPSVIVNTWQLFWLEVSGNSSTHDLGGGIIGAILFAASYFLFDEAGTKIIAVFLIVIGVVLVTGKSLNDTLSKLVKPILSFFKQQWLSFIEDVVEWKANWSNRKRAEKKKSEKEESGREQRRRSKKIAEQAEDIESSEQELEAQPIISNFADRVYEEHDEIKSKRNNSVDPVTSNEELETDKVAPQITFIAVENADYELPPKQLLHPPKPNNQSSEHENIYSNARKLEKTFQSFGVKAKVTKVHLGPAVTKYEVYPDVGVKVSKIVNRRHWGSC